MMKLSVFTGMLVLCGAVAACSSSSTDSTSTGSGGSGGSSGAGEGGDGTTTGEGAGTTGTSVSNSTATTASGTPTCEYDVSEDPACNACGGTNCCVEITTCYGDETGALCFDPKTGALDTSLPDAAAMIACLQTSCEAECFEPTEGGICTSGITYGEGNEDLDACLGELCCDEYLFCTSDGTDPQGCLDCFTNGGGPLCDDAIACEEESGCFGFPLCESGIAITEEVLAECLSTNCCVEFSSCTLDGEDVQGCLDCLEAGGGPECDDAIACDLEFACGLFEEG
jgi:hypothetical protein